MIELREVAYQIPMVLKLHSLLYQQTSLQQLTENTNLRCPKAEILTMGLGPRPLTFVPVTLIQTNVYEPQVQEKLGLKDCCSLKFLL